jgi:hypothetical protein
MLVLVQASALNDLHHRRLAMGVAHLWDAPLDQPGLRKPQHHRCIVVRSAPMQRSSAPAPTPSSIPWVPPVGPVERSSPCGANGDQAVVHYVWNGLLGLVIYGQSIVDGSNGGQRQHVGVKENMSRSGRVRRRAFGVGNLT